MTPGLLFYAYLQLWFTLSIYVPDDALSASFMTSPIKVKVGSVRDVEFLLVSIGSSVMLSSAGIPWFHGGVILRCSSLVFVWSLSGSVRSKRVWSQVSRPLFVDYSGSEL